MTQPLLLTEQEAADRLRLSARTLRKARAEGQLHFVLIGRAVRYTIEDLESFVQCLRQVKPPCPAPRPGSASAKPRRKDQGGVIVPFHQRNRASSGRDRL